MTISFLFPLVAAGQSAPAGLAAAALANPAFTWNQRQIPGFRVHFLADSYPARHQDSLLRRLPVARQHALQLLEAEPASDPIDLFFVESRPQMEALVGGRATGFAQPSARAVFLMTNPEWRAFEKHEIMHVAAVQAWGPARVGNDWLQEGLAQFADGHCGGYPNPDVALSLANQLGWITLDDMLFRFRAQSDLRAYLQAASLVQHLHARFGPDELRRLWRDGATPESRIEGETLRAIEAKWRAGLAFTRVPTDSAMARIQEKGCG